MEEQDKLIRFEESVMPHMDAAYNLARWLAGNNPDAQDVVQEAYLRAFKFFAGFRGGNSRSWLLRIVRNAFYDWVKANRREETLLDEDLVDLEESITPGVSLVEQAENHAVLHQALAELPVEFREILVLRELEDLSYKEIASLTDLPIGTVMSRLARGRERLRAVLAGRLELK